MSKSNGGEGGATEDDVANVEPAAEPRSAEDVTEKKTEEEESPGEKCPKDDRGKEIMKLTMLINKYNSDLDVKRSWRTGEDQEWYRRDIKCAMFFNKEVTIRPNVEPLPSPPPPLTVRSLEPVKKLADAFGSEEKFKPTTKAKDPENSRNDGKADKGEANVHHPDVRTHNSLTSLSRNIKLGLTGVLKSKIPSMTAIEARSSTPATTTTTETAGSSSLSKFNYWDHWDALAAVHSSVGKRINLQISKSSNDNNRNSAVRLRKDEGVSASDSKLLNADADAKRQIKKCDKKSRGDSPRKERCSGTRKQVQWNTEVDVIYFSTHLASNGDKSGEVIGRVMEPLREEWEQQRKGFYAKMVPCCLDSHLKDRFISLLKI